MGQKDMYFACSIITPDGEEFKVESRCFDEDLKRTFEHNPSLYQTIESKILNEFKF